MKPNGIVLVRDYGVNDHSMIRFDPGHKLADKFYARQDGTRTFFFSLEEIDSLFLRQKQSPITDQEKITSPAHEDTLFRKIQSEYVFRETVNLKENFRVPRVFIQSKFIKNG